MADALINMTVLVLICVFVSLFNLGMSLFTLAFDHHRVESVLGSLRRGCLHYAKNAASRTKSLPIIVSAAL